VRGGTRSAPVPRGFGLSFVQVRQYSGAEAGQFCQPTAQQLQPSCEYMSLSAQPAAAAAAGSLTGEGK
jgi:hypothetical protein